MKKYLEKIICYKFLMLMILVVNLVLNLLIYYNTTTFRVSESHSVYLYLEQLQSGIRMPLLMNTYRATLSYVVYGFIQLFGSIEAFFWFHALIATLCVYVLYLILKRFTKSYTASILGVLLATLYLDFHLLVPVLYYQLFEILFTLLLVLFTQLLIESKNYKQVVLYILILVFLFYTSMLFRGTLRYIYYVILMTGLVFILKRDVKRALIFVITFVLMYSSLKVLPLNNFTVKSRRPNNNFKFFGHTQYGGAGGEGAFIYERNKKLYEERLRIYMQENEIDSVNDGVIYKFQEQEIMKYKTDYPYKWIMLQIRKIVYTYSIIPIKDSLILLKSGKFNLGLWGSAAILQFPFVIIMLLFVGLVTLGIRFNDFKDIHFSFIFLTMSYLICATSLYGHYQERYRIVVVMASIIPLISYYIDRFIRAFRSMQIPKYRLITTSLFLLATISFWLAQAYNALVINYTRFFSAF